MKVSEIDDSDLESLSARVAEMAPHRLPDLKIRAAIAAEFLAMEPNFGHEVVALLMREGAAQVTTVNWDRGVENAGRRLNIDIESVSNVGERLRLAHQLPLFKLHGCATRPETLAITRKEVDNPQGWARSQVGQALTGGMVAFVGLGTLGIYVAEPIEEILRVWPDGETTVHVVDPNGPSVAWQKALGDNHAEAAIELGADEFLDDLLRAYITEALSLTEAAVRSLDDGDIWSTRMLEGCKAIRVGLADSSADAILRWWRDGVTSSHDGKPFIYEHSGRQSLMALAYLAGRDGGDVRVEGAAGQLRLSTSKRYLEIVHRPGTKFASIESVARDRVRGQRERGLLRPGMPVAVAVAGGIGSFPSSLAPTDIGAATDAIGELGSETLNEVHLVRSELAVTGELAG